RRQGHQVTVVRRGSGFARTGPDELTLDPRRPEDYPSVFRAFAERAGSSVAPDLIIHAFSVGLSEGATPSETVATAQSLGLLSLLFLTQAIDRQGWGRRAR